MQYEWEVVTDSTNNDIAEKKQVNDIVVQAITIQNDNTERN